MISDLTPGFDGNSCCLVSHRILCQFLLSGFSLFIRWIIVRSDTWFLWKPLLSGLIPSFMIILTLRFLTFYYASSCPISHLVFMVTHVVWSHPEYYGSSYCSVSLRFLTFNYVSSCPFLHLVFMIILTVRFLTFYYMSSCPVSNLVLM